MKDCSFVHSLTPHLIVKDGPAAIEFYKKAFGAVEHSRLVHPEDGKLMHAMLQIGDSALMLCEECPDWGVLSPESLKGSGVTIHLYVEKDVDGAFQKAVDAGATAVMPPQDMFWGDRYGKVKDPFGHDWSLAERVRQVTPEEMMSGMMECAAAPAK